MNPIDQLIEDYQRKIKAATDRLEDRKSIIGNELRDRLTIRRECYRTFLTELQRPKKELV